jgi:branched-chain amino acid transport system substrate-binding protein
MTIGFVWNQSPEAIAFSRRYYARTHRMPDVGQAGVYSAVLQYLRAIDAIQSDDGSEIMKYLKEPGRKLNDAVLRDAYVRADGKMMKPMYLIRIKKPGEMAHEWDYYDVKKVISGEEASIQPSNSVCPLLNTSLTVPSTPADAKAAAAKAADAKTADAKAADAKAEELKTKDAKSASTNK